MLDWNKIDNENTFQRLVNHLFALECNSPCFIPSSPYIGADGSWDGYFPGYYPAENITGVWSIQSKWTTKSFNAAVSLLKPQIKEELKKAKRKSVSHLRIATNAELRVEQVLELNALNDNEVDTLSVWHRENLTRRIELQPFIRHFFFGSPQYLTFVPSDIYFPKAEPRLLDADLIEISAFNDYRNNIKSFITSDTKSILLIHAPGGYGKSHLLKETSTVAHSFDTSRQTWLIRAGLSDISDSLQNEIVAARRYLIIWDDAEKNLDDVNRLLAFCKIYDGSMKIILTSRTAALPNITEIINRARLEEMYHEMSISSWERSDLITLLRIAAQKSQVESEEEIAIQYPNPFLIVWIGKQIGNISNLDIKDLKRRMVSEINTDAGYCLEQTLTSQQVTSLLLNLACIVPFGLGDNNVIRQLAIESKTSPDKITEAVHSLIGAGVLRQVGWSVRFSPDMIGDLYLSCELERKGNTYKVEHIISTWAPISLEKLFTNLASASEYGPVPALLEGLSRTISSWITVAEHTSSIEKQQCLIVLQKIGNMVPEASSDLLATYINITHHEPGHPSLTTDDYGPVIQKLLTTESSRYRVVQLIGCIKAKVEQGSFGNYKPESLISDSVCPAKNSKAVIHEGLDVLTSWLSEPNEFRVKLIASALSEVLAGSHEVTRTNLKGITFFHMKLLDKAEIRSIRNKALDMVKSMLASSVLEVAIAGIQIAYGIGVTGGGLSETGLPLKSKIENERGEILNCIKELISHDADVRLLIEIEKLLLIWWANQIPGTEDSKVILCEFPRTPEYMFIKYFVSRDYAVEDFREIEQQAPSVDRWRWFVHNIMGIAEEPDPQVIKRLAHALEQKHQTIESVAEFLSDAEKTISQYEAGLNPEIVTSWTSINPRLFFSIRENQSLWRTIPQRFVSEINFVLSEWDDELICCLYDELLLELPNPLDLHMLTFLKILTTRPVECKIAEVWLRKLIVECDSKTRAMIVRALYGMSQNITIDLCGLLHLAISQECTIVEPMLSDLSYTVWRLQSKPTTNQSDEINGLKGYILERLKDSPRINGSVQLLLSFCLDSIDDAIDFIDYRLTKGVQLQMQGGAHCQYESIPDRGIDCLVQLANSYDDYVYMMDQLMKWQMEKPAWSCCDITSIIGPRSRLTKQEQHRSFFERYIDDLLATDRIENAIEATRHLALNETTSDTLLKVCEKAIKANKIEDAETLLHHKIIPTEALFSLVDGPPQELVDRGKLFSEMDTKTESEILHTIIRKCIQSLEGQIKQYIELGEEFLNRRV